MKKVLFFMMAILLSTVMYAQDRKMSELKTSQLPKGVTDFIAKNMPGATITRAGKIEDKSEVNYVAVVEMKGSKHAYLFDKDGKFKEKGDHLFNNKGQAPAGKAAPAKAMDPKAAPAPKPPVK